MSKTAREVATIYHNGLESRADELLEFFDGHGFVIVPKEPTPEIKRAAHDCPQCVKHSPESISLSQEEKNG